MVSWVPGSPIDWAAITPIASPTFNGRVPDRGRSSGRRSPPWPGARQETERDGDHGSTPAASMISTRSSSSKLAGAPGPSCRSRGSTTAHRRGPAQDALRASGAITLPPSTTALTEQSVLGAAILLGDDGVLGDVDQAPCQIAGVGGLERRVRQALAGAVGRVEVLENRQALLEVGDDRRLDDLARRLGHQPAPCPASR